MDFDQPDNNYTPVACFREIWYRSKIKRIKSFHRSTTEVFFEHFYGFRGRKPAAVEYYREYFSEKASMKRSL